MASSRWKRFAFFDRQNLNLASEVLEDVIPIIDGTTSNSSTTPTGRKSRGNSNITSSDITHNNDSAVSLVVSTVALPWNSRPKRPTAGTPRNPTTNDSNNNSSSSSPNDGLPLKDMWSSLTACTGPGLEGIDFGDDDLNGRSNSIRLPSQAQYFEDDSNVFVVSSEKAVDGLVLAFLTSRDTDYVHCFDLTVRCNPPEMMTSTPGTTGNTNSASSTENLEDMDGWRGYFAPFKTKRRQLTTTTTTTTTTPGGGGEGITTLEDRIVPEHMQQQPIEGIVHIASCRTTSGHRPLHLACITKTNVMVCVDPHLFLSWYVPFEEGMSLIPNTCVRSS